jgi:hypothetical protein
MTTIALPFRLAHLALAAIAALPLGAAANNAVEPGGWEMKAVITARENPSTPPKTLTESTTKVCLSKGAPTQHGGSPCRGKPRPRS